MMNACVCMNVYVYLHVQNRFNDGYDYDGDDADDVWYDA